MKRAEPSGRPPALPLPAVRELFGLLKALNEQKLADRFPRWRR